MGIEKAQINSYGRYVGRVGALAAALGIGVFVATTPGLASADSSTSSTSSSTSSQDSAPADSSPSGQDGSNTDTDSDADTAADPDGGVAEDDATDEDIEDADAEDGETDTDAADTVTDEVDTDSAEEGSAHDASGANESDTDDAQSPSSQRSPTRAPTVDRMAAPDTTSAVSDAVDDSVVATPPSDAGTTTAARAVRTVSAVESVVPVASPVGDSAPHAVAIAPTLGVIDPFLEPAPATPGPATPIVWAVLGWVRRNLFNQAPTINYDSTTTVQTGQTVTGSLGATDPEGDALAYIVKRGPQHGTLTVDQATGTFTYTPDDIDYSAAQTDSFSISVADGKLNLLKLFRAHRARTDIDLAVLSPTAERVIVALPPGFTNAAIPRFAADGHSLLFSATPPESAAGSRREIYQVDVDGGGLTCLTCTLVDPTPLPAGSTGSRSLYKPVPFQDGSGRILMQSVSPSGAYTHVIYEPDTQELIRVLTPAGKPGVIATDPQREMRISPDGTHVIFTQIQLVPNPLDAPGFITAVPIVGALTPATDADGKKVYTVTDARVLYPVGEVKQWTHDGKGVIVLGGLYESGNVDDILVDIATGEITRLTGNLDYDEDADLSPNNEWITIDSARGLDALTPVTRIVRPAFLPLLIQGSVYTTYRGPSDATNVTNQPWLVAVADDLDRENGIALFVSDDPTTPEDEGDNWTARSMPSWNADGAAVAFWEADATDLTGETSRLVVANLRYTTSVGAVVDNSTPPLSSDFPTLSTNTPTQVQLPAPGSYTGAGGGTAVVIETTDATTGHIIRTVEYIDYVNDLGMILNGTESTDQSAAQNTIHYVADITIGGSHTGSLTGDATINKLTRTITPTSPGSQIQSTLDGDTLVLLDPARVAAAQAGT